LVVARYTDYSAFEGKPPWSNFFLILRDTMV
jgi:hypothetical protein